MTIRVSPFRSLRVIRTDTDRSGRQYLLNFPTTVHLTLPLRGFPLEFCNGDGKLEWCPNQNVKKVLRYALDGQTDIPTD